MNETNLPWQHSGWLRLAYSWIHSKLKNSKIENVRTIELVHDRPWSIVYRVTTASDIFFFKASAPEFGYETALTKYLFDEYPGLSPEVIASDFNHHWLLMRESGVPLRNLIKAEGSIERWREVTPIYVDLQKRLSTSTDKLLGMGVMDRQLNQLPNMFEGLVSDEFAMLPGQPEGLTADEYKFLRGYQRQFEWMCTRLDEAGIPASLHHDDFHDGNIFIQKDRIIFTDWGECAVTHPFFSLVVMLRSLENSLNLAPDSPEVEILRDWYLEQWKDYGTMDDRKQVARMAERIGYVNRALTWHKIIAGLPEFLKPDYANAVPAYLREFINSEETG